MDENKTQQLIDIALHARQWAYAPYSKYRVGAALLTASGRIYEGVNIENAAYPTGICAERVAIFKAVSEGEREFETIVVATQNGGSPCGSCRQVLAEFGLTTRVIIVNVEGTIMWDTTVRDILPDAFTPEKLV
ncbi:MAG TPA: cytidine deaminase [Anaerolineaceae bacterium]|nr:cytidine deaminase [Anaerolineaceae bacterium]